MGIIKKNTNGSFVIDAKAIEDIAQIACDKVSGVIPYKKDKRYVDFKNNNGDYELEVFVKLVKGCDVEATCHRAQTAIYEKIFEMTEISLKNIDINIQGFEG